MRIGVLALQGGVAEHRRVLESLGATTCPVRRPRDMDGLDAVVLPGGESTVIDRLARLEGLDVVLAERIGAGLPCLATCAGLVYLARDVVGAAPGQATLGVLDVEVRRNAFGSQLDSFETELDVAGVGRVPATFIRAPLVCRVGEGVEVISRLDDGRVVGVRQGAVTALAFHPEETDDPAVHRAWLETVA